MLARPGLPEFDYIKAESPDQVFRLLEEKGEGIRLYTGGTDLFIQMRDRDESPGLMLDLKGLPGMQQISYAPGEGLVLGAAVTLNQLSSDSLVNEKYPVLAKAADTIGNYQLRNRATLGGNICNASPSADMAPALLIYKADLILTGPSGERQISVQEFWIGPGKTVLAGNEYLKAIVLPDPPPGAAGTYLKIGRSKMGDLAIVGVAVLGYPDDGVPAGLSFRIGLNSTAPTPYRVPAVEEFLSLQPLSTEMLAQAADAAMDISAPIEDVRASALYQRKMVRNLTLKGLTAIWEQLQKAG
jgi:CO/xanthine dehydrogenase FAD-binding subunit